MFEYFYNQILRKTIISFGSLFNNMDIKHTDSDGKVTNVIKVPLAYGPTQKFLARLNQSPDLNKPVQITLPRMSFEFTGLTYDSTRKVTTTQTFTKGSATDKTQIKKTYMPVPYNMEFELSIMTKLNDDMLQIIEQIIPYFQPSYNLTVNLIEEIGEKKDIPVVLESITMTDDYEGDFTTRRVLIYTLRFVAKTYIFGPTSSASSDIITKATIGFPLGSTASGSATREVVYSVERRAIKNYTGTVLTNISKDITPEDTIIPVNSVTGISAKSYLDLEGEEIYVKSIAGNTLTVQRGADNTTVVPHLSGAEIKSITTADNSLIPDGDDFGFSGSTF